MVRSLTMKRRGSLLPNANRPLRVCRGGTINNRRNLVARNLMDPRSLLAVRRRLLRVFTSLLFLSTSRILRQLIPGFRGALPFQLIQVFNRPRYDVSNNN